MLNVETKRPIIPISITLMALLNILKVLESDISPLYALFYLIITTNSASSIYYVWPPGCKEPNQDGNCICPKLWTPFSSLIYFNLQFDLCSWSQQLEGGITLHGWLTGVRHHFQNSWVFFLRRFNVHLAWDDVMPVTSGETCTTQTAKRRPPRKLLLIEMTRVHM